MGLTARRSPSTAQAGASGNTLRAAPPGAGLRVTREEYLDLPEDGYQYDMIDGVLVASPSPLYGHGRVAARLAFLVERYLTDHRIAEVVSDIDVLLPDGGDVVRPDLTVLLKQSIEEGRCRIHGHIHGVPDVACEILSEATADRDLGTKADRYLQCGVREYWIADPRDTSMQIWFNRGGRWEKRGGPAVASAILEGLTFTGAEVFPG